MPVALQKGHEFWLKATSNGMDFSSYQSSETVKKTIDLYLERLNEYVNSKSLKSEKKRKSSC